MIIENKKAIKAANKKKKKYGKKWLTVILIIFIVLAIPIALIYGFFFDNTKSGFGYDSNYNFENDISNMLTDSFDSADDGKLSYSISVDATNNMINKTLEEMKKDGLSNSIKDPFLLISADTYVLSFSFDAKIFVSRAYVSFKVSRENNNDDIVLALDNIKLGRGSFTSLGKFLLNKVVNDNLIKNIFGSLGIDVTSDMANNRIIINEKKLFKNIKDTLSSGDLFASMLDVLIDNNLVTISHSDDSAITMNVTLLPLSNNSKYAKNNENYIDTLVYNEKVVTLLNNGKISLDQSDEVYSFLLNGYTRSSDEIRNFVQDIDMSIIGINDYQIYEGTNIGVSEDLLDEINDQIDTTKMSTTGEIATISEDMLTGTFNNGKMLGYNVSFKREISKLNYKYNNVVVDSFFVDIKDNNLIFTLGININGFRTHAYLSTIDEGTRGDYSLTLKIDVISYGSLNISSSFENKILDMFATNLSNQWFSIDASNKTITIDISKSMDESTKAFINTKGGIKFTLLGDSMDDNGFLTISINE